MKILKVELDGYRNLDRLKLTPSEGVNFICGKNAQGKTNFLESLWMLTGARSFRGTKDADLINFEKNSAFVNADFLLDDRIQNIKICFDGEKRKAFLNSVPQKYPTNIIGTFRSVLFSPLNLALITGGPEKRRHFIDAAICQLKPAYASLLIRYNHTLKQRNALLKSAGNSSSKIALAEVLNESLSNLGAQIIAQRVAYLEFLKPEVYKIYSEISGNSENLKIKYVSRVLKFTDEEIVVETIKNSMQEKLIKNFDSDLKSGFTSVGPHKDDIEILINENFVKNFGSQGQQRSAALALKFAEASVLEKKLGDAPVILLDDVMSELDEQRREYMISKIKNRQVFITGCDESQIISPDLKIIRVQNGVIYE